MLQLGQVPMIAGDISLNASTAENNPAADD